MLIFVTILADFVPTAVFKLFGTEKVPKMTPRNIQNHGFRMEGMQNLGFPRFLKIRKKGPPGPPQRRQNGGQNRSGEASRR